MQAATSPQQRKAVDQKRRVKVYRRPAGSKDSDAWVDHGTGHVSCVNIDRLGGLSLQVRSEGDGHIIIQTRIMPEVSYELQQDILIYWNDPETGEDLALSFLLKDGCNEILQRVRSVQLQCSKHVGVANGGSPAASDAQAVKRATPVRGEGAEAMVGIEHAVDEGRGHPIVETIEMNGDGGADDGNVSLPPCEVGTLKEIATIISTVHTPARRDAVADALRRDGYIASIVDQFHVNEDLENLEGLHSLFDIAKGAIMLNEASLLEMLFSDENIMEIIGMLEYDPGLRERQPHREYLTQTVIFKEAVPIREPEVVAKIHQTFRVQYIKDVILPRILDDLTFSTLNSFLLFNHVDIVTRLIRNEEFLGELFEKANAEATTLDERRDIMLFLQEFTSLARSLQAMVRNDLYKTLADNGLFRLLPRALAEQDTRSQMAAIEIFSYILQHDANLIRTYMLGERKAREMLPEKRGEPTLASIVMDRLLHDTDGGVRGQIADFLRSLLDSSSMEGTQKTEFLTLFYEECMPSLVSPVASAASRWRSENGKADEVPPSPLMVVDMNNEDDANLIAQTIDLLSYCVVHHAFHIRNHVIRHHVPRDVVAMAHSRFPHLVLAAVRFIRTIVGMKDDFFNRQLIASSAFGPIVDVFVRNGDRYNLLNSAVIELFEFLRSANIKLLVSHVCQKYADVFKEIKYVETFQGLLLRNDQNNEPPSNGAEDMDVDRPIHRRDDVKQDAWFDSDDEDAPTASLSSASASDLSTPATVSAIRPAPDAVDVGNARSTTPPLGPVRRVHGLVDYDDEDDEFPAVRSPSPSPAPVVGLFGRSTPPVGSRKPISINISMSNPLGTIKRPLDVEDKMEVDVPQSPTKRQRA